MNAPNRSPEVAAWVHTHRSLFVGAGNPDDIRRELLIPLATYLNGLEKHAGWGRLVKTDRTPPFVPHDILMWQDTGQHYDVFTGAEKIEDTEPTWGENPPPENPAWIWQAVGIAGPLPEPLPLPPSVEHPDYAELLARVQALEARRTGDVDFTIRELRALDQRIETLEQRPAPVFELPRLRVRGNTGRAFGHGHTIDLPVEKV